MGLAEDIIQATNELLEERSQMTYHHCTTCNRQVLHDGTTCCVCAEGELAFGMPEPDLVFSGADGKSLHCYEVTEDRPTTSIERYARKQFTAGENHALREIAKWCGAESMPTYNWVKKCIERKAAEVERLREALEAIECDPTDYRVGSDENMERVRELARNALAARKGTTDDK